MSRENMDLARRTYDAFNRRDLDALLALTHPEVEVESRLVAVEGGYHGHEGVRRWWNDFLGMFPDYTIEVESLRDLGDVTFAQLRGRGHAAASDTPLAESFWQPVRWRDGKCVWWRNFMTEAEALEALGIRE
jgi:ketosteroid isomerase-like protein